VKADILIFDLTTGQSAARPLADPLAGGRLLTAQLATELVDPLADPLGPGNILALAAGPLAGMRVSTAGRLSIGAKSPLTRGIKEANAGGMAADSLAALGYRALVLTGARPADQLAVLILMRPGRGWLTPRPTGDWATRRPRRRFARPSAMTTSWSASARPARRGLPRPASP
jgi:hypothetical protein